MRSSTIRILILSASVLIAAIIAFQVHSLSRQFQFEQHEFVTAVTKSIRGLYEDLELADEPGSRLNSLIERPDGNSFLFMVDSFPSKDTMLVNFKNEFDDFEVYTDCVIAAWDADDKKILYQEYIPAAGSQRRTYNEKLSLPVKDFSYCYLYFPHRNKYIIGQMTTWIVTSVLLIILLLSFAAAMYYFFKQKFLVEIQKDFINNVTHEFSTPLTVIDLSTDALEKPSITTQPDKYKKYVESIRYQTAYLKSHISNLINTVVSGHYDLALKKSLTDVHELLSRASLQLEPMLQKKNGIIETHLYEGDSKIHADEENLYLAIFNIINNAIKYSKTPKIIITTDVKDNMFTISVKDNGKGIEPPFQKKIFKKFYRVQNGDVHDVKGLGLGLYFTKKVIDAHYGHIYVNSIPGIGTEFKIELPK